MTDLLRIAVLSSPGHADRIPATEVPASDITVSCDRARTLVSDLAELIGFGRGPLLVDGRRFPGTAILAETSIADGSVVGNPADVLREDIADTPPRVVTVRITAGPNGGRSQDLPIGAFQLTRRSPVWVEVDATATRSTGLLIDVVDHAVTIAPGDQPVVVNGVLLAAPTAYPLTSDININLGSSRLIIEPWVKPLRRRPPLDGAVHRIPRAAHPEPTHVYVLPELPKAPGEAQPLSWIAMLAPIPGAALMAMILGMYRLLWFAAFSPLAMMARWYDIRRRTRKQADAYAAAVAAARATTLEQVLDARSASAAHANATSPGPAEVVRRALVNDPRLWERRPAHGDFAVVTVAIGERPWRFEAKVPPEVEDLVDAVAHLDSVPITVDLSKGSVGIVGSRTGTLGVARALLLELATLSGPADVPLALVGTDNVLDDWDWAKWLPHLGSPNRLAQTNADAAGIVAKQTVEMPRHPGPEVPVHPVTVLLIDGVELLRRGDSPLRQALAANNGISGIVVADAEEDLPASCNWVVTVHDDGLGTVADMVTGLVIEHVTPVAIDVGTADAAARALARLTDPDAFANSIDLPSHVPLPSVTGSVSAEAVIDRWEAAEVDPNPIATLGVGPMGPFEIDLVKDGPHVLLAGTTGAGKSELLRSLVLSMATRFSPDVVNFVLVDYKGGGAFDACAELPHTVALVTDLDGHLGARALRSLQAELRHREVDFRETGAHDLGGYRAGGGVMPRLVVVADEFATLAAELPDFLDALIDIAQRGRSLGIHMVLATQRPAGVVDAKIKSNTNLRISLRVQDDADSQDVIGTNLAARLRRTDVGRGYVRMGAGDIVPLQSAYAGGVTHEVSAQTGVSIGEYRLRPVRHGTGQKLDGMPTDMERMVSEIRLANDKLGLAAPRKPWLPELPESIGLGDLEDVQSDELHERTVVIGLLDVPSEQRRAALSVPIGSANVAVYGAEGNHTADTLRTITVQAMRDRSADELHVYLLDSGSAALRPLRSAPHVGAYVPHDDDDLLGRVLDLLDGLLLERKSLRSAGGDIGDLPTPLVVVDGLGGLFERLNDAGDHATMARLGALVRESASLGMSIVGSASTERQIPGRVSSQVSVRLLHRMADPAAVVSFGLRQKDVPVLTGKMILDVATTLDGVAASIQPEDLCAALASIAPATNRPPATLRVLQDIIVGADLAIAPELGGNRLSLPVGVRIRDVAPEKMTIDDRATVLGPPGSGRTSTLVQLAQRAVSIDLGGTVVVVAEPTSALARVDGVVLVAPSWSGAATRGAEPADPLEGAALVIVDDADRVAKALGSQLAEFAQSCGRGRWIIAAMKPADAKAMMEWTRVFRAGSSGLILKPQATDGDVLKVMFSANAVAGLKPGQGILVHNGVMSPVQAALP